MLIHFYKKKKKNIFGHIRGKFAFPWQRLTDIWGLVLLGDTLLTIVVYLELVPKTPDPWRTPM